MIVQEPRPFRKIQNKALSQPSYTDNNNIRVLFGGKRMAQVWETIEHTEAGNLVNVEEIQVDVRVSFDRQLWHTEKVGEIRIQNMNIAVQPVLPVPYQFVRLRKDLCVDFIFARYDIEGPCGLHAGTFERFLIRSIAHNDGDSMAPAPLRFMVGRILCYGHNRCSIREQGIPDND